MPLIGFLESIAIAKAFARKNRYKVDASQELVALGIANCLSSFVSSYPVTGSFSRTAVNAQSGVATPAGGIRFSFYSQLQNLQHLASCLKYVVPRLTRSFFSDKGLMLKKTSAKIILNSV